MMAWQIITNLEKNKGIVQKSINKYGFDSEHDYYYLMSHKADDCIPTFVSFPSNKGIMFLRWDDGVWQVISEVLAPENEKAELFMKFSEYALDHGCRKILVESFPKTRKSLLILSKNHEKMVIGDNIAKYKVPIISLKSWDPELNGPEFSKLRKAKNRFFRNYKVRLINDHTVSEIPYEELEKLVHSWKDKRKNTDKAFYHSYTEYFRSGFKGGCATLAIELDGKLAGIASAIPIPRSKGAYFHISLHDYSIPELGDFLNVLFFDKLKSLGYEYVDFGSSDEGLYNYKKKFKPESSHEKVCFYVRSVK
jgi:lysylphosphatidylglycerol synthetase-like protein (DUF2156 family)